MKKQISFDEFCESFKRYGREGQFSHYAKKILFDYLEETSPDYELDIIALCCEWSEDQPPEGISFEQLTTKTTAFLVQRGENEIALYQGF